jgi:asparagine synthetase A
MPRKNLNEVISSVTDTQKAAESYITLKSEEKEVKSKIGKLRSIIISAIQDGNTDSVTTDYGSVVLSYRNKDVFDEKGLIELFKTKLSDYQNMVVRTKEYIDFDAVEELLYKGKIDSNDIMDFRTVLQTPVLNIKKKKGE